MGFPTALSANEITIYSQMQFATDCYLMVWGNPIVLGAQVNQPATSTDRYFLSYDSVSSGVYTDALEGMTVYLSHTNNIRDSYWWGRLRSDATATNLLIEYTSIQPTDDDYLWVIKDVRPAMKPPYVEDSGDPTTYRMDYNISFRKPPPIIYGIPTFTAAELNDSGYYDFTITPAAHAVTSGATISSWALTTNDGGSTQAFNSTTGEATIRYSADGDYMPRLTVTDSNGLTSWFAPFLKIGSFDRKFLDLSINGDIDTGWNCPVAFWGDVSNVLDNTICAVYAPHKTRGNQILHVGRLRSEDNTFTANNSGVATFNLEGIAQQMNALDTIKWRYKNEDSPTNFTQMKDVTPWRMVGAYIREFTNINNTHSLQFTDTTNDFEFVSYNVPDGTVLDSLREQIWSNNSNFEFSNDGMIKMVRDARYLSTSARNALTTIADLDFDNYSGDTNTDDMYSLRKDYVNRVGKTVQGFAWYNSTSNDATIIAGFTPAVQPSKGTEKSITDSQILVADQTRGNAETEAKQRSKNDFAANQVLDTLDIRLSGGFLGKINPSISQWYTHTVDVTEGIRRFSFDSSDRWLLPSMTINYTLASGVVVLDCSYQIESEDLGFSTQIKDPPPVDAYALPVLPPMPPFNNVPFDDSLTLPSGAGAASEQQIRKKSKQGTGGAKDPSAYNGDVSGNTALVWSAGRAYLTRKLVGGVTNMEWSDVTPPDITTTIREYAWDRDSDSKEAGVLLESNADPTAVDTTVHYSNLVADGTFWTPTAITDLAATNIRVNKKNEHMIYGISKEYDPAGGFPIGGLSFYGGGIDMDGDGTNDLLPSDNASVGGSASDAAGTYDSVNDRYDANAADNGGIGCNIKWAIPAGVTVTAINMRVSALRGSGGLEGERTYTIQSGNGDTAATGHAATSWGSGPGAQGPVTISASASMPITAGTAQYIFFHNSMDRPVGTSYARIEGVQINGTITADHAATRVSYTLGNYEPAVDVGLMDLGAGSFDIRYEQTALAASNEQVKVGIVNFSYSNADQGNTPSQYAKAIWKFGRTTDDYLLAPDGGSVGLYKIVSNVRTDITPNDGLNNGFVIGPGGLAMVNVDEDIIYFLGSFGGSIKLAYSTDLGATWNFNTVPTATATWLSVNPRSTGMLAITDDSSILYSSDGGVNFVTKPGPISGLRGIAIW